MNPSYKAGYKAGYYTGRVVTRVMKFYLAGKVLKKTFKKVDKIAKNHRIDSTDPGVVSENIFECLEYLD